MGVVFNINIFLNVKFLNILFKDFHPKNDNNLTGNAGRRNVYVFMTGFFICLKIFFLSCRGPPIQSIKKINWLEE